MEFGKIPSNLSMTAGQAMRVNAGGNAFEAYTPGSGGSGLIPPLSQGIVVETDLLGLLTVTRSIAVGSNKLSISNANGVSGNPTLDVVEANFSGIPQSAVTNLTTDLSGKQATLVSATNIKTINGSSILGSGDLTVSGSGLTQPQIMARISMGF